MRALAAGLVAFAVAAGGAAVGAQAVLDGPDATLETSAIAGNSSTGRFLMTSMDDGQGCVIEKGAPAGGFAPIVVPADCDRVVPGLSAASAWHEGADGTVTISSGGGLEIVRFAQADGADYESFYPATPLLVLSERD